LGDGLLLQTSSSTTGTQRTVTSLFKTSALALSQAAHRWRIPHHRHQQQQQQQHMIACFILVSTEILIVKDVLSLITSQKCLFLQLQSSLK